MAKIGLISDTHSNLEFLKEAADFLVHQQKINCFYHCGDDYHDADLLLDYGLPLLRVPGIFEPLYKEKSVPAIQTDEVEGSNIILLHDIKDLNPEAQQRAQIVIYGHSHQYEAEKREGKIYINPGHLKDVSHKGRPASFGLLSLSQKEILVKIFNLSKKVLLDKDFSI